MASLNISVQAKLKPVYSLPRGRHTTLLSFITSFFCDLHTYEAWTLSKKIIPVLFLRCFMWKTAPLIHFCRMEKHYKFQNRCNIIALSLLCRLRTFISASCKYSISLRIKPVNICVENCNKIAWFMPWNCYLTVA